jgi:hypothetical protein
MRSRFLEYGTFGEAKSGLLAEVLGRLLLPGEAAGVELGEDVQFDQAFQLGPGAFDVLRQHVVAESLADVLGPQEVGRVVEDSEDAWLVRVFGQLRRGCGEPVGARRSSVRDRAASSWRSSA